MAETPMESSMDGVGPGTVTFTDSAQRTRPQERERRLSRDETEDPVFDVTDPQQREDCLVLNSAEDAIQRLADYEQKIGRESSKTSISQRRLLARDQLVDYYRNFANEQAEFG
jgi:hypothetical protein